jgi:putative OmpL-like beta-barrel porin-2
MLNSTNKLRTLTLGATAIGAACLASLARAEEGPSPVVTALSSITLSGYIDTSMHWNPGTGNANPAPYSFNVGKQDGFNLNAIDLSLEKALDDEQWSAGYKVEIFLGPDAAFVNGSFASPVRQAYAAVRVPIGNGVEFQAGRYDDLTGYEATDKWKNPNYTHSYGWSIEPTEHTGVVGSYSFSDWVSVKLGVANTWTTGPINERALEGSTLATAHQADSRKTIVSLVSLNAPTNWWGLGGASFFVSANNGYGSITKDETYLSLGTTLNTPVLPVKLGAGWDYSTHFAVGGLDTGPASAINLYVLCRATEKLGLNVRAEYARADGLGALSAAYNGAATHLHKVFALTATLQYDLWKNVLSRLEARWDHAADGIDSFGGTVLGAPTRKNEVTLAAEFTYRF